jgi:hypothetical protein
VAALRGEDGERQPALGPGLEAVDQVDAGAELRALLRNLQGGRRAQAQPQHPDLAGQRQDGDGQADAEEQGRPEPEPEPLIRGQAALGQQRESGEAHGEGQVAGHRPPADGRPRAEARAWCAGPPPQQGPEERRREHGHERGGEQGGLVAARGDPGGQAELGRDQQPPGNPAAELAVDPECAQGSATGAGTRQLQNR